MIDELLEKYHGLRGKAARLVGAGAKLIATTAGADVTTTTSPPVMTVKQQLQLTMSVPTGSTTDSLNANVALVEALRGGIAKMFASAEIK